MLLVVLVVEVEETLLLLGKQLNQVLEDYLEIMDGDIHQVVV
jgi:hypothetical protein